MYDTHIKVVFSILVCGLLRKTTLELILQICCSSFKKNIVNIVHMVFSVLIYDLLISTFKLV